MPSSQRAVLRDGGSNPADNFVRNCTFISRSKCSGKPPPRKAAGTLCAMRVAQFSRELLSMTWDNV